MEDSLKHSLDIEALLDLVIAIVQERRIDDSSSLRSLRSLRDSGISSRIVHRIFPGIVDQVIEVIKSWEQTKDDYYEDDYEYELSQMKEHLGVSGEIEDLINLRSKLVTEFISDSLFSSSSLRVADNLICRCIVEEMIKLRKRNESMLEEEARLDEELAEAQMNLINEDLEWRNEQLSQLANDLGIS